MDISKGFQMLCRSDDLGGLKPTMVRRPRFLQTLQGAFLSMSRDGRFLLAGSFFVQYKYYLKYVVVKIFKCKDFVDQLPIWITTSRNLVVSLTSHWPFHCQLSVSTDNNDK